MSSIVIMMSEPARGASTCMLGATGAEQTKLLGEVMAWLKSHPNQMSTDNGKTIITALKALYPCR